MSISDFRDLRVWQEAHALTVTVYRTTMSFPKEELFGLISQMRRCAASVAANLAEGFKRRGTRDKARFYNISQASLEELRYYFILSRDLGFDIPYDDLMESCDKIGRMLTKLIRSQSSVQ